MFQDLKIDEHKSDATILLTEATKRAIEHTGYQLHGELSSGGYGAAFEVRHQGTRAKAVIKVMLSPDNADHRKAFKRECKILAADHVPSDLIPGFITSVETPGVQPFVVMEFIAGAEIHNYVERPTRMPLERRVALAEKLFRAYERLHSSKLVHGDPSSRNVLVEPGDRMRLIDFGSGCRMDPGYGSVGTVSYKGITPSFGDEDILINGKRPDRWTDLYAVAGISYHVLTGEVPNGAASNDAGFERGLLDAKVPAAIVRVLIKARTKRDDRLEPDQTDPRVFPSALAAADAIQNWRNGRVRRATLFKHSLVTVVLMSIVGFFGAIGWQKYLVAEAAADLKVWQSLQAEIRELPNLTHPAVAALRATERRLISKRDEAIARDDRPAARLALSELLSNSREVLHLAREVDRAASLREAIGKVLLEDKAGAKTGFWITQAPMINQRLDEQKRRYVSLAESIKTGDIAQLPAELAGLQLDLGELFRVNIEARSTFDARVKYELLRESMPARLRTESGYRTIEDGAQAAEKSWSVEDWDQGRSLSIAKTQFGLSQDQLEKWLSENETPAERSAREKDNQERVATLEAERRKLLDDAQRKAEEVARLNEQFTKLTQERLDDAQKLKTTEATLVTERKLRQDAEGKLTDIAQTKSQLTKANQELAAASALIAQQKTSLEQLDAVTKSRDLAKSEADRWKKLATDNPGVVIPFNDKLTEIEKLLATLDLKDWDAARAAFVKAGTEYRKIEGERAALLAPNQFEAKHPKVKAKDTELALAQTVLEAALKKVDAADKLQFEKLQHQIDSRQNLHDEERALGVAEQNSELVELRKTISGLKQQQSRHSDGTQRADGTRKALTITELVSLTGAPVVAVPVSPGGKLYADKNGNNYVRIEAGEFLMGAPSTEADASDNEKPQHQVRISQPFYFGEKEETQAEWQDSMGFNPSYFSATGGGADKVKGLDTSKFPVDNVCWYDICDFANRKSLKNGLTPCYRLSNVQKDGQHIKSAEVEFLDDGTGFRMPKEAEFEYVARAGTKTPFWFGSTNNGEKANVDGNSPYGTTTKGAYLQRTTKVGSYAPNPFGIYDTVGNVWEPCQDIFDAAAYGKRGNGVTVDPFSNSGSTYRVFRGGSWFLYCRNSRVAYRFRLSPVGRYSYGGCRLVLPVSGVRTRND